MILKCYLESNRDNWIIGQVNSLLCIFNRGKYDMKLVPEVVMGKSTEEWEIKVAKKMENVCKVHTKRCGGIVNWC